MRNSAEETGPEDDVGDTSERKDFKLTRDVNPNGSSEVIRPQIFT